MKTSAQDSVVSARTLQRHGHTVSVLINDGKFLMNFRAQPLIQIYGDVRVVGVVYRCGFRVLSVA